MESTRELLGLGWEDSPLSIVFKKKICKEREKGLVVSFTVLLGSRKAISPVNAQDPSKTKD